MDKKMPKTFEGKSTKLGGGGRFAMLESKLEKQGKSAESAKAIAAAAGRKSLGNKKMTQLAQAGKKRAGGK